MEQNDTSHLNNRNRRGIRELLILPGTKWCGNGRLAKTYNDIDGYMKADHCCRTHDLCPSSIPRFSRKFGLYNYRLTTISHCSCDKRNKRAVTDLLSVPNTKWCGKGYRAKSYDQLGGLYGADSCCRQHDLHCPFFIQSFERKYGYFHFGLSTISHCACDRRKLFSSKASRLLPCEGQKK
ncbi:Group 3 secretory phospholipase A2 [Armadillidium vulgare]|nr:Group 3 secretory phospholipase A2 [Armadillidium vulgare]